MGSAKDWVNRFTQAGDEYLKNKAAQTEVSQEISKESPWTSGAATVASFVPDIALTRGMSGLAAAPTLTALHAGSRIIDEPGEVAQEALLGAGAGFILDKGANFLNKIAQRRGQVRALPGQQDAVLAQNQAGQQATNAANLQQEQQFNALTQQIKSSNQNALKQHQQDLLARQNNMIQAQNAYDQAKLARDNQIINIKNQDRAAVQLAQQEERRLAAEYKNAKQQYEDSLRNMPEIQRKAQEEYSSNVVENARKVEQAFPKNSKILSSQLGTNEFVDESIRKSGLAGTREGNQASKILKSIFPEGEILTASDLSKRYRAIEDAISKASPEVQSILNEYKQHLGERLPAILTDNIAYSKVVPVLQRHVGKYVEGVLEQMAPYIPAVGPGSHKYLNSVAKSNINQIFRELTPEQFLQKLNSGELKELLKQKILPREAFSNYLPSSRDISKSRRHGTNINPSDLESLGLTINAPEERAYNVFSKVLDDKLDKFIAQAQLKTVTSEIDAGTKLGRKLHQTLGVAPQVSPPQPPVAPGAVNYPNPTPLPPQINPPPNLPIPPKPNLINAPQPPAPQTFTPQALPTLPGAQGAADITGDFLEKNLMGGKGPINNPFTKLAGLKYVLGKGALPLEAGYLGLKGLTSPTQAGEMARMTFKTGGIQFIDQMAQKYPSYHNGILESPQERRSLNKEIEDDQEIPMEQKAVLQSKVNRGKSIFDRL